MIFKNGENIILPRLSICQTMSYSLSGLIFVTFLTTMLNQNGILNVNFICSTPNASLLGLMSPITKKKQFVSNGIFSCYRHNLSKTSLKSSYSKNAMVECKTLQGLPMRIKICHPTLTFFKTKISIFFSKIAIFIILGHRCIF